jgi:hypothetical protein
VWGDAILAIHKKLTLHGMKFETKGMKLSDWESWQQIKAKEVEYEQIILLTI